MSCIQKMQSSNLGWVTNYLTEAFCGYIEYIYIYIYIYVHSRKLPEYVITPFFHIHFNPLFTTISSFGTVKCEFFFVEWDLIPLRSLSGPLGSGSLGHFVSSPLGPYKSQHCGHIGLLYIFPG
jgi:hypothetical protein